MMLVAPGIMVMTIIYFLGALGATLPGCGVSSGTALAMEVVLTTGLVNPVRSLAPDLVRGAFHTSWIYVVGPLVGAMIGVAFEWILKGKPTATGGIAAQGTLDIDEAAEPIA
jgi:aquaporin Z